MQKKALITGITGQDGSYLVELLLSKGYEVHGLVRRSSTINTSRIKCDNIIIHSGDLSDSEQINNVIYNINPEEVYHLGAQSHVGSSFESPEYTGNITGLSTTRILESIRRSGHQIRFYQASSSEMFGGSQSVLNEQSILDPRSPYACAKIYAYWMARNYRDGYNMFATNGILFNHESPRRGEAFVTRKITLGIVDILMKRSRVLYLGNLDAQRDWGFSPEYVEVMWKMLQADKPDDFVIGTGETHSVREFLDAVFSYVDLSIDDHVQFDKQYARPNDVNTLIADSGKAEKVLGWKPKIKFKDLVKIMIDADLRTAGIIPPGEGDAIIVKKFPNKWWKGD